MTVRLRAHHLLCLLTYVGRGYTPAFTANYDVIAERLCNGEDIIIVAGPDDICAPLLGETEPHCWNDSVVDRDRLAVRDIAELLAMPEAVHPGTTLTLDPHRVEAMRAQFASGAIRQACGGCEWSQLCSAVAAGDYAQARILPRS